MTVRPSPSAHRVAQRASRGGDPRGTVEPLGGTALRRLPMRRIAFVAVGVSVTLVGALFIDAIRALDTGRADAITGIRAVEAGRLDPAAGEFESAARRFRRSGRSLTVLDAGFGWLPGVSSNLALARAEAGAGEAAAMAATELLSIAARIRTSGTVLATQLFRERELALQESQIALRRGLRRLRTANVPGWTLRTLDRSRATLLEAGPPLLSALNAARAVAALASPGKRYLLVVQNPAELRGAGGLIGAWGLLSVDGGRLALSRLGPNTALPAPRSAAPAPADYLSRYRRFDANRSWVNANMSPDFPTTARVLLGLYRTATGKQLDGVVAVDAVAFEQLLNVIGPITVAGRTLTSSTFRPIALAEAYTMPTPTRVDFLLAAAREGWRRIESGSDAVGVARVMSAAARSGHVKAFSLDPEAQGALVAAGLSGALATSSGDHLLLVRQNAGGNKLDYYFYTRLVQAVALDREGGARTRLAIELRNDAPAHGLASYAVGVLQPGQTPGSNRGYFSVYASRGAEMLAFRAGPARTAESADERGRRVFSWFDSVPPHSTRRASVVLASKNVATLRGELWTYRLFLEAQPELNPPRISVSIDLPPGARLRSVHGGNAHAEGANVRYTTVLDQKQSLQVTYCFCS